MKNSRWNEKVVVVSMYSGLGVGFVSFLAIGLVPGLLYGGYMGLIMAGAMFGTPVEPTLFARFLTGGGMGLGVLMALTFFLVAGSVAGTITGLAIAAVKHHSEKSAVALQQTVQEKDEHKNIGQS